MLAERFDSWCCWFGVLEYKDSGLLLPSLLLFAVVPEPSLSFSQISINSYLSDSIIW